jgi:hypothetical protein
MSGTVKLVTNIRKLRSKKFYNIWLSSTHEYKTSLKNIPRTSSNSFSPKISEETKKVF